jgi:hypothetical protein
VRCAACFPRRHRCTARRRDAPGTENKRSMGGGDGGNGDDSDAHEIHAAVALENKLLLGRSSRMHSMRRSGLINGHSHPPTHHPPPPTGPGAAAAASTFPSRQAASPPRQPSPHNARGRSLPPPQRPRRIPLANLCHEDGWCLPVVMVGQPASPPVSQSINPFVSIRREATRDIHLSCA